MELALIRTYGDRGTNGYLVHARRLVCCTIELPWRNNRRSESCIPEGSYRLRQRYSPKFGHHLEVTNVPDRSLILLHPANIALKELRGCIAPVTQIYGEGRGGHSRMAMRKLLDLVVPVLENKEEVILNIHP